MEIVSCLHYFGPDIIRETAINEHCIFHSNNGLLLSLSKSVFFVHIRGCVFDYNALFFAEVAKFDGYKFSSTVCTV